MHDTLQLLRLPAEWTATVRDDVRERGLRLIAEARRATLPVVRLDARAVASIDGAGLGDLLLLEKRAAEAGVTLVLEHPTPMLVAVLRATGLASVFLPDAPVDDVSAPPPDTPPA